MQSDTPTWPATADGAGSPDKAGAQPDLAWLARPTIIFGLIGLYLIAHFLLRLGLSPTLGLDDAEQVLFAQQWDFGYRFRQPPLFTWLLRPVVELIGPGILAVSIVRYALLALTFAAFYLTARLCLRDQRMAGLAVLSFSLIYVFAYYAHHDLTHTTALGAMIALALYLFVKLAMEPTLKAYLLLGAVFGLGVLAKWNFVMLAIGLPLTCLALPAWRHLVLTWKMPAAMMLMAIVITPTSLWMADHGQSIQSVSDNILGSEQALSPALAMLQGLGDLAGSALLFPLPFLPLFFCVFLGSFRQGLGTPEVQTTPAPPPSVFGWLTLIVLALHALLVPIFGSIDFTERWMHPALMALPLFLFGVLERAEPTRPKIVAYLIIIAIMVAVSASARLYRYAEGADDCESCREFVPFGEFASDLRARGFSTGTIVADGMHIGGNFKMLFPESRVIDPAFPMALWPDTRTEGMCLLLWQDNTQRADKRRRVMRDFAQHDLGLPDKDALDQGRLEAPLIGSSSRHYALGFELYEETAGGCR